MKKIGKKIPILSEKSSRDRLRILRKRGYETKVVKSNGETYILKRKFG